MRTLPAILLACTIAVAALPIGDAAAQGEERSLFDLIAEPEVSPYEINGTGFVTVSGHPMHPGDFERVDIAVRLMVDPELGESIIDVVSGEGERKDTDRYFVRRGRIFQIEEAPAAASDSARGGAADSSGAAKAPREIPAQNLGDVLPATVATIHPAIVANAMVEQRGNVEAAADSRTYLFAWNNVLWRVSQDEGSGRIGRLTRRTYHERLGDGQEEVRYEGWVADGERLLPGRVVVTEQEQEILRVDFGPIEHRSARALTLSDSAGPVLSSLVDGWPAFPVVDDEADIDAMVVAERDLALRKIAPHVFTIEVPPMNTRVIVAEFADHLAVIEGVYNSRNCDVIARVVRDRFAKPVRWFWFSHLHGQYIGGVRSWIHEGATVLVPPTTAPLVEKMAAAPHALRPDALELARAEHRDASAEGGAEDRRPRDASAAGAPVARVEPVAKSRRLADDTNAVEIYNVESGHTDEYFITYFPGPKILLTGDLLFLRPGKPLTGRSKKLCDTVATLGLDVETYVCTWPLGGYGTKNIVSAEEMRAGCEAAPR